jgi:hypothetical protein
MGTVCLSQGQSYKAQRRTAKGSLYGPYSAVREDVEAVVRARAFNGDLVRRAVVGIDADVCPREHLDRGEVVPLDADRPMDRQSLAARPADRVEELERVVCGEARRPRRKVGPEREGLEQRRVVVLRRARHGPEVPAEDEPRAERVVQVEGGRLGRGREWDLEVVLGRRGQAQRDVEELSVLRE